MERNNLLNQIHQVINRLLSSLQETPKNISPKINKRSMAQQEDLVDNYLNLISKINNVKILKGKQTIAS